MTNSKGPRQEHWGTPQAEEKLSRKRSIDGDLLDPIRQLWAEPVERFPTYTDIPVQQDIREFKQRRFSATHVNLEWAFISLFIYLDATKFVLLSVFTLIEMIRPRSCSKSRPKGKKSPLPFDVRLSKRRCLKGHSQLMLIYLLPIHSTTLQANKLTLLWRRRQPKAQMRHTRDAPDYLNIRKNIYK